jgi:hypothetical protein
MYFINDGKPPKARVTSKVRADATRAAAKQRQRITGLEMPMDIASQGDEHWFVPEGWSDVLPTEVDVRNGQLSVTFGAQGKQPVNRRDKAVIETSFASGVNNRRVLAFDVDSSLRGGARMAIAISATDNRYFESAPVYLKPGANRDLVFDLRAKTFKSEATEWEYRDTLPGDIEIRSLNLIIYPQEGSGRMIIRRSRLIDPE